MSLVTKPHLSSSHRPSMYINPLIAVLTVNGKLLFGLKSDIAVKVGHDSSLDTVLVKCFDNSLHDSLLEKVSVRLNYTPYRQIVKKIIKIIKYKSMQGKHLERVLVNARSNIACTFLNLRVLVTSAFYYTSVLVKRAGARSFMQSPQGGRACLWYYLSPIIYAVLRQRTKRTW